MGQNQEVFLSKLSSFQYVHFPSVTAIIAGGTNHSTRSLARHCTSGSGIWVVESVLEDCWFINVSWTEVECWTGFIMTSGASSSSLRFLPFHPCALGSEPARSSIDRMGSITGIPSWPTIALIKPFHLCAKWSNPLCSNNKYMVLVRAMKSGFLGSSRWKHSSEVKISWMIKPVLYSAPPIPAGILRSGTEIGLKSSGMSVLVPVKSMETHWNDLFSVKSAPNDSK